MKLQTAVVSEREIGDIASFLRERYPERYSLLEAWEELDFSLSAEKVGDDSYILFLGVSEEGFEKLQDLFPSKEEAKGAFLTTASEMGWEVVPDSYILYHAQFEGDRLIAAVKGKEGITLHDQLRLEEMIQKMLRYPRIIVYSSDVLTYIKDLYPEVDSKAYVVSREIARKRGRAPKLEDLGKIYGIEVSSLENKLRLIEKLLKNPVKLPDGEVHIKPYHYPLEL